MLLHISDKKGSSETFDKVWNTPLKNVPCVIVFAGLAKFLS